MDKEYLTAVRNVFLLLALFLAAVILLIFAYRDAQSGKSDGTEKKDVHLVPGRKAVDGL